MKKKLANSIGTVLLTLVGAAAFSALAAESPPPPLLAETWVCNYNPGKGMGDVVKARDAMLKDADKAGLDVPAAYMWSIIKGNVPYDTVWLNVHENLGAYATYSDTWAASGIGNTVTGRFYAAASCATGLANLYPVFQKEGTSPPEADSTRVVATLGCSFNEGMGAGHMADLANHMSQTMESFGDAVPNLAVMLAPFTARPPGSPDVVMVTAYESMSGWASYVQQLFGTPAGQSLRNHMNVLMDCDVALWSSRTMVAPAAQ